MPRYQYRCSACEKVSTIDHLSSETALVCPRCDAESTMVKLLTNFLTSKKSNKKQKVGKLTEEFIEDSRQELEQQKDKLNKDR